MSGTVKIGYWNCRGYIGDVKLLLEFTGTPYDFHVPPYGPAPQYSDTKYTYCCSTY